ncbi:MAG: amidohydrolase [Desulfobacteraceae bacterium]|nr:amidohydrolase [Desulfobacteraceae bacterium]
MQQIKRASLNIDGILLKNATTLVFIMMLTISASICDAGQTTSITDPEANIIYINGKVYTVNEKQPWAEAVAVSGNSIVFVGSNIDAKKYTGKKCRIIDLKGKMLLPGFIDGHTHPVSGAQLTSGADLQYNSIEKIIASVKVYADKNPNEKIIRGFGWRYHLFPSTGPTKKILDIVFPDRPVYLIAIDAHSAWVNSKALELAGITKDTSDPQPGFSYYQRDPKTKEATGYLVEPPAEIAVLNAIQPQTKELIKDVFEKKLKDFAKAGVTSVFDAGILGLPVEDGFSMYFNLEKQGKLVLRVIGSFYHNNPKIDPLPIIEDYRNRFQSELVQAAILKINVDGGDAQHTGAYLQPYADKPETSGEPIFTPEQLNKIVSNADAAGIDCHFHAFGDRAVRIALDAVEAATKINPKRDRRHALAHSLYIADQDVPRFAKLNVVAQMSPQWAMPDPTNLKVSVERLGEDLVNKEFNRYGSVIRSGGVVAFGTDWPAAGYYSTHKPLEVIQVAMTRKMLSGKGLLSVMPPENEIITLEQAIKSSTWSPAYELHLDNKVGTIEPGKRADLVVLGKNLFDIKPEQISEVKVLMTLMNGKITYEDRQLEY